MNAEEYQSCLRVTRNYLRNGLSLHEIPGLIKQLIEDPNEHWKLPDNLTFHQFVTRKDEHGLGHDWDYLEKLMELHRDVWNLVLNASVQHGRRRTDEEREHAQQIVEIKRQQPELSTSQIAERVGVSRRTVSSMLQGGKDMSDNIRHILPTPPAVSQQAGTSVDYTLQRIRKEDQNLYDRVIAGELSAHQAALQLGFRKRVVSVRMDNSASACATIAKHMQPHVIEDLVRRLQEMLDDRLSIAYTETK